MRDQLAGATGLLKHWRGNLFDLLFPTRCVNCRRAGAALCAYCRSQIQLVLPPICSRCGEALAHPGSVCSKCRLHPPHLREIRAVAYHQGALREAIHGLKYLRRMDLAAPLAELLIGHLQREPKTYELITAVPLHSSRQRERGYNQAELLAREVASRLGQPYADGLQRVRATADQIGLDAIARRSNVRDAFLADPDPFRGRRILLIDDVCTTGATLDACAVALKAAGAQAIYGLAVARPRTANSTGRQNISAGTAAQVLM